MASRWALAFLLLVVTYIVLTFLTHGALFSGDSQSDKEDAVIHSALRKRTDKSSTDAMGSALQSADRIKEWSMSLLNSFRHSESSIEYQVSFFVDDKPNWDAHEKDYSLSDPYFKENKGKIIPYTIPPANKTVPMFGTNTHPFLSGLRQVDDRQGRKYMDEHCYRVNFDNAKFPTMSVIITVQNERPGLVAFTVHNLLARTPHEILKEILVVDDYGQQPGDREGVDEEEMNHLKTLHPKVKIIANEERQGCAGSRLAGARVAQGDVLMFVDSHIEMYSSTWAQHIMLPILENPRTVAMQQLHVISDLPGFKRKPVSHKPLHYGIVNDGFIFGYIMGKFNQSEIGPEYPSSFAPFETVFAPGSLFAIRRDEFWRLGGYDTGLGVWGGENTELALKVWMCGYDGNGPAGRIVVVPCSPVGHVYRVNNKWDGRWPPPQPQYVWNRYNLGRKGYNYTLGSNKADEFGQIVVRNNMRILRVWVGKDHYATKRFYWKKFEKRLGEEPLDPEWQFFEDEMDTDPEIKRQESIRDKLKCRDFDWFDKYIYHKKLGVHHPWHDSEYIPISCGSHSAQTCGECPQGHGATWCNGHCHWCPNGAIDSNTTELSEKTQCVENRYQCRPKLIQQL